MRKFLTLILGISLLSGFLPNQSYGQSPERDYNILLRSGVLKLNPSTRFSESAPAQGEIVDGKFYRIVQFHETPGEAAKQALEATGANFIEYLPHFAFVMSFPSGYDLEELTHHNVRSLEVLMPTYKMHPSLISGELPSYAIRQQGTIDIVGRYYNDINPAYVLAVLNAGGFEILEHVPHGEWVKVRIPDTKVSNFAAFPFFVSIEPDMEVGEPEDTEGKSLHRTNVINSDYSAGRHYDGEGVTACIYDDGFAGPHVDFKNRTDQSTVANDLAGDHGDMTTGILGGAGNIDPTIQGMAPASFIHVLQYSSTMAATVGLHTNSNVMVFSTSYSNGCNAGYTTVTRQIDQEVNTYPEIFQSFSAGNSAGSNCGYGAGSGWGTVTGGHKIAKNVTAVANLYSNEVLETSSSRGPAEDGRLKPDISANGQGQMSTDPYNGYAAGGGTSAACPGIAGIATQLYGAYKSMNSGNDPESGLIKVILLNTADEIGNAGPDFTYGWGRVNARKAVETLEDGRYTSGTASTGNTTTHSITVPANVQKMKVMIHWRDPAASTIAATSLVNDLDITITDPGAQVHYPLVLDPTPNVVNLTTPAVPGVDTLNNVEQITIDNPTQGVHTLNVIGTNVPQGPQSYWMTYIFEMNEIVVTYPNGGEGFTPGQTERIRWDANVGGTGNFTIEYSTDNGTNWSNISTSVPSNRTWWDWNVPSFFTGNCWVRVSRNGVTGTHEAPFSIMGQPTNLRFNWVCPDSAELEWNGVFGATGYDIFFLGNKFMDSVGTTTNTRFVITGINPFDENWASVRATGPNNGVGRRQYAVEMPTGIVNCSLAEDASLSLLSPASGQFYTCIASDTVPIKVRITNNGTNSISNIPLNYSLNGAATVTETYSGTIPAGSSVDYSFSTRLNMLTPGTFNLDIWSSLPTDGNPYNDTLASNTQVLSGTSVSYPWADDFETFPACGTDFDCEVTVCALNRGWMNYTSGTYDDIDFRSDAGGTPSNNTGPSQDHNPGTNFGKYVYTEASNGCIFQKATMISPCIDLSNGIDPQLTFWYHMYGADMGKLAVDIISNMEIEEDVVTLTGNRGNVWVQQTVDLKDYEGKIVQVRFRGETGADFGSDMALDDINLTMTPVSAAEALSTEMRAYLFPNPTAGEINLKLINGEAGSVDVKIYNLMMQELTSRTFLSGGNEFQTQLNVSTLPSGVYLMRVSNGDRSRIMKFEIQ